MRTRRIAPRIGLLLATALLAAPAPPREAGEVHGKLSVALPGIELASIGPIAVYLEPLDRRVLPRHEPPALLRQRDAQFLPGFSIATAGAEIKALNDDEIFHNVFSFSGPNAFDLGLYPRGESRSFRLKHPGEVHVYCSIHESMSAVILVVPTPYYVQAGADGAFRIDGVMPGRYRLRTWNATLPPIARELEVAPGSGAELELALGNPE